MHTFFVGIFKHVLPARPGSPVRVYHQAQAQTDPRYLRPWGDEEIVGIWTVEAFNTTDAEARIMLGEGTEITSDLLDLLKSAVQ